MNYIVRNFTDEEYYFINERKFMRQKVNFNTRYRENYNNYLYDLKQAMDKCGLENDSFATHDYRRCYARRVWEKYKDLFVLQELLNHTDPKTTMRYLKGSGLRNIDYHKEMQS
jgi:integrase